MGILAAGGAAATAIGSAAAGVGAAAGGLTTAGAIGLAGTVLGAGVSAYSAISQGQAAQKQANYQAEVAKNNELVASYNATRATQAGQSAAQAQGMKQRAAVGAITAGEAASGVDVGTGSAGQTRETQREIGALDVNTVTNNAAVQAYGYRTQSTNFDAQAGLDTASGANAAAAGTIGAAGSLIQGASSVGLNWQKLQQVGGSTTPSGPSGVGQG